MKKVNLADTLARISTYWDPKIVAELNGQEVRLVKLRGEFVWHHHEREDELFLVLRGRLTIQLRNGDVALEPGEMMVVPRGVEHRPVSSEEVHVLVFEPASTVNTGGVESSLTRPVLERLVD